ncbi:PAN1 [Acrasis kona]|uniref:PAN1 n=1 Tax=Acrasis kona TaxID=1008807 RepID=A0AAW2YIS4_9EUKA
MDNPQPQYAYYQPYGYGAQQQHEQVLGQNEGQQPPQQQYMFYNQQAFYPQIPVQQINVVQQQPPQQPQQPQQEPTAEENQQRRCLKKLSAYKFCASISIVCFVLYFLFTPGAFPWFLVITCFSLGAMASKYIREQYSNSYPRFRKHVAWYVNINATFLLFNLWSGGLPWSVVPAGLWGIALGFHAVHSFNRQPLKTKLLKNLIVFAGVAVIALVLLTHDPCPPRFGPRSSKTAPNRPPMRWRRFRNVFKMRHHGGAHHNRRFGGNQPVTTRQPSEQEPQAPGQESNRPTRRFKRRVYCEDGFYYTYIYDTTVKVVVFCALCVWFTALVVYGLKIKSLIRANGQELIRENIPSVDV